MEFDLTIFVPTYNRPAMLEACISSIERSLKNENISYEILVINESPTDVNLKHDDVMVLN